MKIKFLLFYFLLSLIWIFGTNYLLDHFIAKSYHEILGRGKEVLYVLVTGGLLYFSILKSTQLRTSKEDEKRLSTLINSMVDFVNFKDGEGRWIEANNFGLQLFQLENVDYRGKKDSELAKYTEFYHDALTYCEVSDEEAWKNKEITRIEEIVPVPDGSTKIFDTIKVPLFHSDGSREGIVIIGRDITERKKMVEQIREQEERLRRSEKLSVVGELSASVAHEIRNPLTSLIGFVQLLQKEDHSHQQYYQIMLDELNRINHIVGELLLLAKPQVLKFTNAEVKKLFHDVISLLSTEASLYNVHLEVLFPEEDVVIECEPNQLKQLFINIIKNGIEAAAGGGEVAIHLEKFKDSEVFITIKDNGCGITKERMEKIGEPFYSSKEKGTGLGLTVSSKIVQSHKGEIHFDSVIHKGTVVNIKLPVSQQNGVK